MPIRYYIFVMIYHYVIINYVTTWQSLTAKIISTSSGLRIQNPVLQDVKISLFIRPPTVLEAETHFRLRQNGTLLQVPNELVNVEEEGVYSIKNIPNYFVFNQPHFSSIYTKGENLNFPLPVPTQTGSGAFYGKQFLCCTTTCVWFAIWFVPIVISWLV